MTFDVFVKASIKCSGVYFRLKSTPGGFHGVSSPMCFHVVQSLFLVPIGSVHGIFAYMSENGFYCSLVGIL